MLLGIKEYYEGSILKFIDGKYSEIYPENVALETFINFPEAINVLTKEPYKDKKGKIYDAKADLEEELDVEIPDTFELDSLPNIDEEIYDGSIETLNV